MSRRPTGFGRVLPGLLIVGAQRCGTSSLYKYLGEHPRVVPSIRKEIEYFSTRYFEGENWYRSHFQLRFGPGRLAFEATPDYLLHPLAAQRAFQLVPHARIVVMLRDPVDRAYSQYRHNCRLGLERLSFGEALEAEPGRLTGEMNRLRKDTSYRAVNLRRHGYVERGRYDEQVRRWWDLYPRDQILIVRSEDFFDEPARVYANVVDFLGLPPYEPADFRNYSLRPQQVSVASDPPGEIDPTCVEYLIRTFASHNERLSELLDRDLGWQSARAL